MTKGYTTPSLYWDFVRRLGESQPPVAPGSALKTSEANDALFAAYRWAYENSPLLLTARAAAVYIQGIERNRQFGPDDDAADIMQLSYIVSNLRDWESIDCTKILVDYVKTLKEGI